MDLYTYTFVEREERRQEWSEHEEMDMSESGSHVQTI